MIEVHHLNNSRSQRILWLLEELGLDYEIVRYQRDPVTRLAPPALKAIQPLGKSPYPDGGLVVAKSGRSGIPVGGTATQAVAARDSSRPTMSPLMAAISRSLAMLPLLLSVLGRLTDAGSPLARDRERAKTLSLHARARRPRLFVATRSRRPTSRSRRLDAGGSLCPL